MNHETYSVLFMYPDKTELNECPFLMAQYPKTGAESITVEVPRSHTVRHTLRRTNSDEYQLVAEVDTYTHKKKTTIHAFSGIRISDPSNYVFSHLLLRKHGHWDCH